MGIYEITEKNSKEINSRLNAIFKMLEDENASRHRIVFELGRLSSQMRVALIECEEYVEKLQGVDVYA